MLCRDLSEVGLWDVPEGKVTVGQSIRQSVAHLQGSRESENFSKRREKLEVPDQSLRVPQRGLEAEPGEIPWGAGVQHEVF